jgi:hypothetical protein
MRFPSKPSFRIHPSNLLLFITLLAAFSINGCGQDYNSNSGDKPVGAESFTAAECGSSDAESGFCAARLIYQRDCFSCHPGWADLEGEAAWVSAGLVVPGDIDNSKAINRLINYGSDMPLYGSALSESDYKTLKDWINSIEN